MWRAYLAASIRQLRSKRRGRVGVDVPRRPSRVPLVVSNVVRQVRVVLVNAQDKIFGACRPTAARQDNQAT